jgi:hypothetical protein
MGQDSQDNKKEQIQILEAQIRDCFGRSVWSHKTQEKASDIAFIQLNRIKWLQFILSALVTSTIITLICGQNNKYGLIILALLSTCLTVLNAYTKDYDLGGIAQKHANTANQLRSVREEYLSLLTDIKAMDLSIEDIVKKRDKIQEKLDNIYSSAQRTNEKSYNKATKALKEKEELTLRDEEIDSFLPKPLKKLQENKNHTQ